ncbi:MAG: N-acetylneuraminate synthase family protein [Candidatus Omnitrophota bacterium]|nr:N-acetylneuraminate synthase family protein [Candidatus Omnitrophota bacterium]
MNNYRTSIVAIIPAKTDSKRLPNKNMALINGKPLLYYTIKTAKECGLLDKIYVSTDSATIAEFAKKEGISVIMRPAELAGETPVVEVYRHALLNVPDEDIVYVVGLQPDHPDRTIDLEKAIKFALEKDLDDLISIDSSGLKNGSIRIMKAQALKEGRISVNSGSIIDNSTNIHSLGDLKIAQIRLKQKGHPLTIKINGKIVSKQSPTFIIAEGACNHICDMDIAKKMIDAAEASGADAIKFQTYKAERLVAKDAKTYWNYSSVKSQYEYYKKLDKFDRDEYKVLFDYAKNKEIIVFSSPFDAESADMLNELGMPLFKIASCLIPDLKLIKHIAKFKKPIILSLGGSEVDEIKEAIDVIYSQDNYSLILLACTLSYPSKNEDAHLLRIRSLQLMFPDTVIGYSDHTEPDENMVIPSLAVSLGAKVIEKHFTLDRAMTGSGHSFSVDPVCLKKMVENIRLAEKVMGSAEIAVKGAEEKTRLGARMSVVAAREIKKDAVITEDMLTVLRPGTGISPRFISKIANKRAKRDIAAFDQLNWDDIE